ncbi:hypothetical protein T484DRAFT_1872353, partial [Baffinella frigidus]
MVRTQDQASLPTLSTKSDQASEPTLWEGSVAPDDVVQGALKDCWFLGALAIVAAKPGMLLTICKFSYVQWGVHLVSFFVDGQT